MLASVISLFLALASFYHLAWWVCFSFACGALFFGIVTCRENGNGCVCLNL